MDTKKLLFDICSCMSISGFEYRCEKKLREIVMPYFDECIGDSVGNHIFVKKSKAANAPKLLIDTHYDEVGLMVKGITDEGFLRENFPRERADSLCSRKGDMRRGGEKSAARAHARRGGQADSRDKSARGYGLFQGGA